MNSILVLHRVRLPGLASGRDQEDSVGMTEFVERIAEPFTAGDLVGLGVTPSQLRRALGAGHAYRLLRGVYVGASAVDDLGLRTRACLRVVAPGHIACDRTAAWIYGIDTLSLAEHTLLPPVETCVRPDRWASRAAGVRGRSRDLRADDVREVGGLLVTAPLRTALDLACNLHARDALAALDQFHRLYGIDASSLAGELPRFRGRRGVVQARRLVGAVDGRAESVRESWIRAELLAEGLPMPELQFEVVLANGATYRLDHAYPEHRVAIEYDGAEFHSTPEQVRHDRLRRNALYLAGWTVIVVTNGDFTGAGRERWLSEVRASLADRYCNLRW